MARVSTSSAKTFFHVYTNCLPNLRNGVAHNTGSEIKSVAKGLATRFRNQGYTVTLAIRVHPADAPCICPSHPGNSYTRVTSFDGEN